MSEQTVDNPLPVVDADAMVSSACDALLDKFVIRANERLRKVGDAVYEDLLISVQDHLKDNANWNLSSELERGRRAQEKNYALTAQVQDLIATLRSAAGWVRHWQRDVECNCRPTPESLSAALLEIQAAIAKAGAAQ